MSTPYAPPPQHQPSGQEPPSTWGTPVPPPAAQPAYAPAPYPQPSAGYPQPAYPPQGYGPVPMRREVTWQEGLKAFFKNYATFSGRASRTEYGWPNVLISVLSAVVGMAMYALMLPAFIAAMADLDPSDPAASEAAFESMATVMPIFALLFLLFGLALIIPSLAITARRLHDMGLSGWWMLLGLIPAVAALAPVLMFVPPKPEGARYDAPGGVQPWPQS